MEINPQETIELEQNLRAPGLNHRRIALDKLAKYPPEIAVPILKKLLIEPDIGLRRLAIMGLGNHRSMEAFDALQGVLVGAGDSSIMAEAANSIFEFGDTAIPILQQLFSRSTNWLVRQTIISLLVETDQYQVLLDTLIIALDDETQTVQEAGVLALGRLLKSPLETEALARLSQLAIDPDWRIRWRTAIALSGSDAPLARQLTARLQQDEHFRVVAAALEGNSVGDRD